MAEEEKEKNQEELAKEWEEALKAQQASNSEGEPAEGGEKSQEELAKEWEEALKAQQQDSSQEDIAKEWEEALKAQNQEEKPSPETEELPEELQEEREKLELLKDIPLEITVEIGTTSMPLEEILRLHQNSIVELDRYINEPVDIKINGKLVAKGKLYTVKENFGVKITQIITPRERLKLLEEE